ncbi:MAG: TIGR00730 family Rossman fold protein [bacterium]
MKKEQLTAEEINKEIDEHILEISREFRQGFEFLKKYPKSVTIFGSSRINESSTHYKDAYELSKRIVTETGYTVITGGGPGIMESANKGAFDGKGNSVGLNIILPHEQKINPSVTDSIHFNYFFVRKPMMNFAAEAYIFFPGGFGTFDELFGLLTLIQTKKIPKVPVILVGKDFWIPVKTLILEQMLKRHHTIEKEDYDLLMITDSISTIIKIINKAPVSEWWDLLD